MMPIAQGYVCLRYGSGHTEGVGPTAGDAKDDAVRRLTAAGVHVVSAAEAEAAGYAQHEYVLHDELEVMPATAAAVALGVGAHDLHECGDLIATVEEAMTVYRAEEEARSRRRRRAA